MTAENAPPAGDRADALDAAGDGLNERERAVLQALVDQHIATAEPVASKAIVTRGDLGVSAATIRSILATLDERGLVHQPHTSAGRVPTDRGLRYYVDSLMVAQTPSGAEQGEIEKRIDQAGAVDLAIVEASRVLSRLSRQLTVVVAPKADQARLRQIELVRIRDDAVLAILVTDEGLVQNRLVQWRGATMALPPSPGELERLANRLTELVNGLTLDEARVRLAAEQALARQRFDEEQGRAIELGRAATAAADAPADRIVIDGQGHLVAGAAPGELLRLKELFQVVEDKTALLGVLERAVAAPGVQIFIGHEAGLGGLADMAVVAASYGREGRVLGTVGVIGPRRLDYGRVVPLVDVTAQVVSRVLSGGTDSRS